MKEQLEHKIAEAYHGKDSNASFTNSGKMWSQISTGLGHTVGVAAIWRVAAIILALITFGGVFASVSIIKNHKTDLQTVELKNNELHIVIDSIQRIKPETIIKTEVVEKEKLVYKEIFVPVDKNENTDSKIVELEEKVSQLSQRLTESVQKQSELNASLILAHLELEQSKSEPIAENNNETGTQKFQLKTEKYKETIQPDKSSLTPKLKLQIFNNQNRTAKYDTNSTLFRK